MEENSHTGGAVEGSRGGGKEGQRCKSTEEWKKDENLGRMKRWITGDRWSGRTGGGMKGQVDGNSGGVEGQWR